MLDKFLFQLVLDILRSLIVDEMSRHVRRAIWRLIAAGREKHSRGVLVGIRQRTRERLLHRIRTELDEKV